MSDTPNTDECTYPADAMGKMLVVHVNWAKHLERENAELRKDRTRLKWLCTQTGSSFCYGYLRENFKLTRAAIDAARKDQP